MGGDRENKKKKNGNKDNKKKVDKRSKKEKQKKKDERLKKEAKRAIRELVDEQPTYTLTYFRSAGNAQGCRLALAAANAKWSNHYVDKDTWPAVKASGLAPFGQCPFVHIQHPDGSSYVLAESHAIIRHVSRQFGFDGADEYERSTADSLLERLSDMKGSFGRAYFGAPEEQRKAKAAEWVIKEWPVFSSDLEKRCTRNASAFLVGNNFTGADLGWYAGLSSFKSFGIDVPLTSAQKVFMTAVESIPGVANFLKSDKNPTFEQH